MASQGLQGNHSACTECRKSYPGPPTIKDIPHPAPFTNEMREYVQCWEENQDPFLNPTTKKKIKQGGRVWQKCAWKYSEFKELQDPESLRNAKLQKALKKYEEDRKRDRYYCQQIHRRAVANSWFVPAQDGKDGKYTCTKCMGEAWSKMASRECHICSDWPGGSCRGCWSSFELECKECKLKAHYKIDSYYSSEEELKLRGFVRLESL